MARRATQTRERATGDRIRIELALPGRGCAAALEGDNGFGVVLERRGSAAHGPHQNLLLEARFDSTAFSARVMLDAARKLPGLRRGAHHYAVGL